MWADYKYKLACSLAENEANDVISSALINNYLKIKTNAEDLFKEIQKKSLTL